MEIGGGLGVDGNVLGSCPTAGFDTSSMKPLGIVSRVLMTCWQNLYSIELFKTKPCCKSLFSGNVLYFSIGLCICCTQIKLGGLNFDYKITFVILFGCYGLDPLACSNLKLILILIF